MIKKRGARHTNLLKACIKAEEMAKLKGTQGGEDYGPLCYESMGMLEPPS